MLEDAEITLLGAGYGRLSAKKKEKITGMAEALKFAQTNQAAEGEKNNVSGGQGGRPGRSGKKADPPAPN